METLHIYVQENPDDISYIAGTPEALALLRNAIDAAILTGRGTAHCNIGDGKDYEIEVVLATAEQMSQMMLPYDTIARERKRKFGFGPWTLIHANDVEPWK